MILHAVCSFSQIQGIVKDKAGNVIPGANVRWKGDALGVMTNVDGQFSIQLSDSSKILIVSNVAYVSDSVSVDKNIEISRPLQVVLNDVKQLNQVEVTARGLGAIKNKVSALNIETLTTHEFKKAACCNLSESFETNASVDVAYDDAATGAKQIKLLGLSGKYVEILTENIPNLRGISSSYGLDYIPGPWMDGIQISKGTASVKNGYEAIAGQINVEYKKPKNSDLLALNLFTNSVGRVEANATSGVKLNKNLYTGVLLHASNEFIKLDENKDGYQDMPMIRQYSAANRWHYEKDGYIMQAMIKGLSEKRMGGMMDDSYKVGVNTERYEFFLKNGFIFDHCEDESADEHHHEEEFSSSLGIILNGTIHNQDAFYGLKTYNGIQNSLYANVIYDMNFGSVHKLSVGTSFNADVYKENLITNTGSEYNHNEYTPGIFGEYSLIYHNLTAMAGLRYDYNSQFGSFLSPRFHLRYGIKEFAHIRLSLGRGFRAPNVLAENNFYLASNRKMRIENNPKQAEDAWNYGITVHNLIPIFKKELSVKTEWFYTDFQHQVVTDLDSNPHEVLFADLMGKSFSSSFQIEANMEVIKNLTATVAHRINYVRTTIGGVLREKPLTNRSKSLISLSYLTKLKKWQFDFTTQFNGGGRLPDPDSNTPLWQKEFKPFTITNAQITKNFKRSSLYGGVENIGNFKQKNPIIDVQNPFGSNFDTSMIWGPTHGRTIYIGIRWDMKKM